jgi:nucleotide-binding universal stress UspA family protein
MYETIYLPVDNSRHSNRAVDTALQLGQGFQSTLVGCHVYAAKMHDYRFKQMEYTLPEEYLVEQELHRQRKIHDSLITMGLELISDCYLEPVDARCREVGLPFERKMMDGKHSVELVKDIRESGYDLVVMGVLGVGRTRDSQIGAVCSRLTAETDRDVWVVKHLPQRDEPERDTVLVGVDGSPRSFGALVTGIELARRFGKKLEVIGVYDPYLHYAVFKGIVDVLTEKAAKIFRFEEQNQLHEEIIDTGLAQIYQSHLAVAAKMAEEQGVTVAQTLLDGKAFQKVLDHARKIEPWVLVVGRNGVHKPDDEDDALGSNTENLLRMAPCDVLITTSEVVPEIDVKAEESIHWTPEALARMDRVPPQVLGIARTAILRLALEQGHSVVSSDLVTEAMERFMPKRAAEQNVKLAEALVLRQAEQTAVALCAACGVAARTSNPVTCTVCGGTEFEVLTADTVARIIAEEGGVEEETTYDGRKIRWTQEAKAALKAIEDRYQRRRAKARIEKAARVARLDPISLDFARRFVEEETGVLYKSTNGSGAASTSESSVDTGVRARGRGEEPQRPTAEDPPTDEDDDRRLLARDAKGVPLLSAREWSEEAMVRIFRVPAGFMRDKTQERVEELATAHGLAAVDLDLVEEGVAIGLRLMEDALAEAEGRAAGAATGEGADAATSAAGQAAARCPFSQALDGGRADTVRKVLEDYPLREVSVMTEMERKRREMEGAKGGG